MKKVEKCHFLPRYLSKVYEDCLILSEDLFSKKREYPRILEERLFFIAKKVSKIQNIWILFQNSLDENLVLPV